MQRWSLLFLSISILRAKCGKITNLPGSPNDTFDQYAGYYTVGKMNTHHMHYWFVESQNNPATDPLILWLTGGPGCSGLNALLTEWGPFMVNPDGNTLRTNPYSWNRNASVLTLESPSGVGFSYTDDGDTKTDDDQTSYENYQALVAFLMEFPQYRKNDFYVTGESFGGIFVPTLVQRILDNQSQFKINLKGMAIGNGVLEFEEQVNSLVLFEYAHGMIDDTLWQRVLTECCNNTAETCPFWSFYDGFCGNFVGNAWNWPHLSGLNPYNIYKPCSNPSALPTKAVSLEYQKSTGKRKNSLYQGGPVCIDAEPTTKYLNRPDVRKALFVPANVSAWEACSDIDYNNEYGTMAPFIHDAIAANLQIMLYSGDVDMVVNYLSAQRFARLLGYPLTQEATKYTVEGQFGGMHTQYGDNLHVVTVRGAGHMVPTDKPAAAYYILETFFNDNWEKPEEEETSSSGMFYFTSLLLFLLF